jgi:glycosyltransferase involved in cell wall biosynthesis
MYIRAECLLQTGLLRDDVFGQGYGEENDFCIRAHHLGWRHVAVPGAYVAHIGGASFGDARSHLLARNLEILERLHPGYGDLIAEWQARAPLAEARRALDAARWAARRHDADRAIVLITHDSGGGVERAIRERCAVLATQGLRAVVLRPVVDRSGDPGTLGRRYVPGLCAVGDGPGGGYPNLVFRLPGELAALTALLAPERAQLVELHHLLGHHHCVTELAAALQIPYEIRVHDYSMICSRINLVGVERRYCGEPALAGCEACVADAGSVLEDDVDPATLRRRSAVAIAGARAIVVPAEDAAARLRRYFPLARMQVAPHEDDTDLPPLQDMAPGLPRRIGIVGGIGVAKGYDTLLACARDAAQRDLALSFTVIGHTEDDERLLAAGRVFITGPYQEQDAVALIRQQRLHLAWLPSIWPETWCYALGEAMRAGLAVAVFDIGAQAERVRHTGRGWTLPLGLSAPAINNALLALRTVAGDVCGRATGAGDNNNLRSFTARS